MQPYQNRVIMNKQYNITHRISAQARKEIERIINTHEQYRNSYFWNPACSASSRRYNERRFAKENPDVVFLRGEEIITVSMSYDESCKNVYYRLSVYSNVKGHKNIAYIKNILK